MLVCKALEGKGMKTREVTSLALKIFALYLLVEALTSVPSMWGVYLAIETKSVEATNDWLLYVGAAAMVVILVLAIFIWKLANRSLIESLKNESKSKALDIVPTEFEQIVYTVLGMYWIITSLSSLFFSIGTTYVDVNDDLSFGIEAQNILLLSSSVIELLIGGALVVYPQKWARLFAKVRRG